MNPSNLTRIVIACAFHVHRTLGHGFLESVYQQALAVEFESRGLPFSPRSPLNVLYNGTLVGHFIADFIIQDRLIVEIKATSTLLPIHESQLINHLRATGHSLGLLLNFGSSSLQIRRKVHRLAEP